MLNFGLLETAINSAIYSARSIFSTIFDVNTVDNTALNFAINNGNTNAVRCLIAAGANVNATYDEYGDGKTLLHRAASRGCTDILRELIAAGAILEAVNDRGYRPLHYAAQLGHADAVKELIAAGANVHALTDTRSSALALAARYGNGATIRALVEAGANLEEDELLRAAQDGNTDTLQTLIELGANRDAVGINGYTSLHWAALFGHPHIVQALIALGANLEVTDPQGLTPLHHAALGGRSIETVQALIEAGANIHAISRYGFTPITAAFEQGHHAIVTLLQAHGAELPVRLREQPQNAGLQINYHQSVHNEKVHKCVSESIMALRNHYQDQDIEAARQAMIDWIEGLTDDSEKIQVAKTSFSRLKDIDYVDSRSGIALQEAIGLVWLGINDVDAQKECENVNERIVFSIENIRQSYPEMSENEVLTKFEADKVEHIKARRETLLKRFYDIHRAYNLDNNDQGVDDPSCASGSFNTLVYALQGGHAKVNVIYAVNDSVILKSQMLLMEKFESLPESAKRDYAKAWVQGRVVPELIKLLNDELNAKLYDEFDTFDNLDLAKIIPESIGNLEYFPLPEKYQPFLEEKVRAQSCSSTTMDVEDAQSSSAITPAFSSSSSSSNQAPRRSARKRKHEGDEPRKMPRFE